MKLFSSAISALFIATTMIPRCRGNAIALGTETCVFVDHVENDVSYASLPCSNNTRVCRRNASHPIRITYLDVVPYVYVWNNTYWGIDEILLKCCGPCVKYTYKVLQNITQLTAAVMEQSDLVFPILSKSSTKKLYGSRFLPYINVPRYTLYFLEEQFLRNVRLTTKSF